MNRIVSFLIIIVVLGGFGMYFILGGQTGGGARSQNEIEKIVANYIRNNPEIILETLENYQVAKQRKRVEQARSFVKDNLDAIINDKNTPSIGNPNADVTVVEFFDYSCGYCKKALEHITRLIKEDDNVRIVFKEFPILGPISEVASKAAIAVYQIAPDKYFSFHSRLMTNRVRNEEGIMKIASGIGIDTAKLKSKMKSEEVAAELEKVRDLAENIGIRGTPAFIVGSTFAPGFKDYDELKRMVARERAGS